MKVTIQKIKKYGCRAQGSLKQDGTHYCIMTLSLPSVGAYVHPIEDGTCHVPCKSVNCPAARSRVMD